MQIKLLQAVQLVEKTMPCALSKFWVWVVVCFAYLAATLCGAGIGLIIFAFGVKSTVLASITAVLGFFACGYILYKLRGSIFVPHRAGHVKVMLDQMASEKIIERKDQIERMKKTVPDYFDDVASLAALDRKIRGVLLDIYKERLDLQRLSFGNKYFGRLLEAAAAVLTAFVAEAVFAYHVKNKAGTAAASSKKALVLLFQHIDGLAKPIWVLNAFTYLGWLFFVVALSFPINWLTGMLPVSFGIWNIVFAMVFAWGIKAVFLESIAVAAFIPVYFENIKGTKTSAAKEKKLGEISKFYTEFEK
ncbi:MAG: hypothetical protein ACU833_02690 [Gammaproteobacteria bacterium]